MTEMFRNKVVKIKLCYKPNKTLKFNWIHILKITKPLAIIIKHTLYFWLRLNQCWVFPSSESIFKVFTYAKKFIPRWENKNRSGRRQDLGEVQIQTMTSFFFLWINNFNIGQTDDLLCLTPFKMTFPFYANSFQLQNQSQYISLKGVLWLVKSNFINSQNVNSILK